MAKQVIFIGTTPQRYDFLMNCLSYLDGYDKYPIIILSDYTYNGKWRFIQQMKGIDEFTILPDSMEIIDTSLFDMMFKENKGKNVSVYTKPYPYWIGFGKFKFSTSNKLRLPIIKTKYDEVLNERVFSKQMLKHDPDCVCLFDDDVSFQENPHPLDPLKPCWVYKFGRKNLVVGNRYFLKYQGTWDLKDAPKKLTKR